MPPGGGGQMDLLGPKCTYRLCIRWQGRVYTGFLILQFVQRVISVYHAPTNVHIREGLSQGTNGVSALVHIRPVYT